MPSIRGARGISYLDPMDRFVVKWLEFSIRVPPLSWGHFSGTAVEDGDHGAESEEDGNLFEPSFADNEGVGDEEDENLFEPPPADEAGTVGDDIDGDADLAP